MSIRRRTGYVCAVKMSFAAVLWTSTCSSIINRIITAWPWATGSSALGFYSIPLNDDCLYLLVIPLISVIFRCGVSHAMLILMLKWLHHYALHMKLPTYWNLVTLHLIEQLQLSIRRMCRYWCSYAFLLGFCWPFSFSTLMIWDDGTFSEDI